MSEVELINVKSIDDNVEQSDKLLSATLGPEPNFRNATLMLLEACNLDCWMCDFGKSKGLKNKIELSPKDTAAIFDHEYFKGLRVLTMTGGEPFTHKKIGEICHEIVNVKPKIVINFSTNASFKDKMFKVVSSLKKRNRGSLLVSIDGVDTHDTQRGVEGCFEESVNNLEAFRKEFPEMPIIIKFTITRINYQELFKAYDYFASRDYAFTAKLAHTNPYYTNKVNSDRDSDFDLNPDEIASVVAQTEQILATTYKNTRHSEIIDLQNSLQSGWSRSARCGSPVSQCFIDSHLNFFTCKEFAPILNLHETSLSELPKKVLYHQIVEHETNNTSSCTYCNSQMRMKVQRKGIDWKKLIGISK